MVGRREGMVLVDFQGAIVSGKRSMANGQRPTMSALTYETWFIAPFDELSLILQTWDSQSCTDLSVSILLQGGFKLLYWPETEANVLSVGTLLVETANHCKSITHISIWG